MPDIAVQLLGLLALIASFFFGAKQYANKSAKLEVAKQQKKDAEKGLSNAKDSNEVEANVKKMDEDKLDAIIAESLRNEPD